MEGSAEAMNGTFRRDGSRQVKGIQMIPIPTLARPGELMNEGVEGQMALVVSGGKT